jgi:hypothetical protein
MCLQVHSDSKRNSDELIGDWHHQFLSTLIGVWPDTTIFVPGQGDIPIPVGSALIFSGSKAHAGSAYATGNRRLHIYFFSSKTWELDLSPLDSVKEFHAVRERLLKEELTSVTRLLLESNLMNNLQVYDFDDGEDDVFDKY